MIAVRYAHGLATRMFQYAFARVLAERFSYQLDAAPLALFPRTRSNVPGKIVYGPTISWYQNWPVDEDLRMIRREDLYTAPGARLSLCGAFQRFDLLKEYQNVIRDDWYRIDDVMQKRPCSELVISLNTCIDLHGGMPYEMRNHKYIEESEHARLLADSVMTPEEIRYLAHVIDHRKLYIVTGGCSRELLAKELRGLNPVFVSGGVLHDFLFILSFQKIAISQSALHWWAAFLSDAREIFFPKYDRGYWSVPSPPAFVHEPAHYGIDLRVEDPRYVYDW